MPTLRSLDCISPGDSCALLVRQVIVLEVLVLGLVLVLGVLVVERLLGQLLLDAGEKNEVMEGWIEVERAGRLRELLEEGIMILFKITRVFYLVVISG